MQLEPSHTTICSGGLARDRKERLTEQSAWGTLFCIVTIEQTLFGDKVVLRVIGRMDAGSASIFQSKCEACRAEGFTTVVLDLSDLTYVSSMGLGAIVEVAKLMREQGGEVRICCVAGLVRQLFEITKLNHIFPSHASVESALAAG